MTRILSKLFATAFCLVTLTASALAQEFPTKPVRIIVPFAPGGLNDVVGRMIAHHLTERFGRQVIVENRTGAGGVVGTELVANSPKDGHTLLIVSIAHAVNPWLYKLNYDPSKSFAPIAPILSSQNALAVNLDMPVKSLKDLLALAKQQPGKIQYASGGVGGSLHLAMELFKITAGVDLLHVPFRGAGPAVIDVIGGHTKAINATISTLSPHIRGGKLRAIGVSGKKRSDVLPDVPTIEEGGVPGYDAGNWIGLAAPAGTPDAIVARLHKEISGMLELPDIQKQIASDGSEIMRMSPVEFAAYMDNEMAKWGRVVKTAGITAQ
ncbi:MAG TPA: tripartite tricarboxylate transporter substrate binding protein [Xanthobacteraceae bacterium]|nr:tripartite tricarboxylate transporter substrate binding protein [Xanthobacteraceae bacterium]